MLVANGVKKGTGVEIRVVDCRMLPKALDGSAVGMPWVDLVVMGTMTRTAQAMVMALVKRGTVSILAPLQLAMHFHFVLNSCSGTSQAAAQMPLMYPNWEKRGNYH